MKIVKYLENYGLVLKVVSEIIQNEAKEQKRWFLGMLLATLGTSLLRKMLAGRRSIAKSQGRGINTVEEWIVRAGYGSKKKLIPSHHLTNCKY